MKKLTPKRLRADLWKLMQKVQTGGIDTDRAKAAVYAAMAIIKTAKLQKNSLNIDE